MSDYNPPGSLISVAAVNAELEKISVALKSKLDKEVSQGNQLEADLDMNSNRILNYPDAVADSDLVTKGQVSALAPVQSVNGKVGAVILPEVEVTGGALQLSTTSELESFSGAAEGQKAVLFEEQDAEYILESESYTAVDGDVTANNGQVWRLLLLNSVANVKWFGAKGDGVTDDTAAILRAVNRLSLVGGGVLYFPYGEYLVSSTINLNSDTLVTSDKATVKADTAIAVFSILDGKDTVVIADISIEGPGSTYLDDSVGIDCSGTDNGSGLAPTRNTNIVIDNVKVNNIGDEAIRMWYSENVLIRGCKLTNLGYFGITGVSSNKVIARDNYIDNVTGETVSGQLNAFGMSWSTINSADPVRYPPCEDIDVVNNVVKNIPNWHGLMTKSGVRVKFKNNTVINCRRGILMSSHQTPCIDCEISGNTIHNYLPRTNNAVGANQQGEAIWDIGRNSTEQNERTIINGNTIYQHGAGIGKAGAIYLFNTKNGSCTNNTLVEPYLEGISIVQDVDDYVIENNTIINPKSEGISASPAMFSNAARGMRFWNQDFNDVLLADNTIIKNDASVAAFVGTDGLLVANTALKAIHLQNNNFVNIDLNINFQGDTSGVTGDYDELVFAQGDVVPRITQGVGSPEGVVTARIGSIYLRSDGAASTSFYVKESGTGNTGWVAK